MDVAPATFRLLADVVLITHAGFVAFVIAGLLVIAAGGLRGWTWTRNPWFRIAHLVAIGVVATQAWFGRLCPLTTLEMHLRERAGQATYDGSFVAYWLGELLYYEAPPWVFTLAYTIFGLLVVACWVKFPPRPIRGRRD